MNQFFQPPFLTKEPPAPRKSTTKPQPKHQTKRLFVDWLVFEGGISRGLFPRHHGSCGSSRFTGNQWLRGGNSVLDGALDQGSLQGPPKVGPLPISFPYNSYTSTGSYGSGMGVVWEWGYHYWVSENGAPVNSLVQNGKTERFVGLLSGTLKGSSGQIQGVGSTNPRTTGRSWTNIWLY